MKKICFVSHLDAKSSRSWSGIVHRLYCGLQSAGIEVELLSPLEAPADLHKFGRLTRRLPKKLRPWRYDHPEWLQYHPVYRKAVYRQVIEKAEECDGIFSIFPDLVANENLPVPWIFFSDATFNCLRESYLGNRKFHPGFLKQAHQVWKIAGRANYAILTSEWAKRSAVEDYGFTENKIIVQPVGANLTPLSEDRNWGETFENRNSKTCRLLWVGVDWERKGGDIAIEIARRLNDCGLRTRLDMVGVAPSHDLPDFVHHHGKRYPVDSHELLDSLFSRASFFLLPSKAECAGIVFSEASSFGLPSLAPDVCGISSNILEGKSGHTFPAGSFVEDCVAKILDYSKNRPQYLHLCTTSRAHYKNTANWNRVVEVIIEAFRRTINK